MATERKAEPKWSMVIDADRCSGCQACVVACQSENNIPLNTDDIFRQKRAIEWIRIERYWVSTREDGDVSKSEYNELKVKYLPLMCQHCENAPCEPVCPVYATYHNDQGLNVQVYNRCIGTRYCANNCNYSVRFFNFWEPVWPESLRNQLNPDVTVRSRGIMEKCSMCVQRIRRGDRLVKKENREFRDGDVTPACVQSCPTGALTFGNIKDENSKVAKMANDSRHYRLLEDQGTGPNVIYLKRVDPAAREVVTHE